MSHERISTPYTDDALKGFLGLGPEPKSNELIIGIDKFLENL